MIAIAACKADIRHVTDRTPLLIMFEPTHPVCGADHPLKEESSGTKPGKAVLLTRRLDDISGALAGYDAMRHHKRQDRFRLCQLADQHLRPPMARQRDRSGGRA